MTSELVSCCLHWSLLSRCVIYDCLTIQQIYVLFIIMLTFSLFQILENGSVCDISKCLPFVCLVTFYLKPSLFFFFLLFFQSDFIQHLVQLLQPCKFVFLLFSESWTEAPKSKKKKPRRENQVVFLVKFIWNVQIIFMMNVKNVFSLQRENMVICSF